MVLAPHTALDIAKIEMIQRRAAQFVHNKYHYPASATSMPESFGWLTLQGRRNYLKLLLTYKIIKAVDIEPKVSSIVRHTIEPKAT